MNLISCDNCGVVLDTNKLIFLPSIWRRSPDSVIINTDVAFEEYRPITPCPVCKADIIEPSY